MNTQDKKDTELRCINVLKDLGFKKDPKRLMSDYYLLDTKIGRLQVRLDIICKSGVMSAFCQFLNYPKAKELFGHWKFNLHLHDTEDFNIRLKDHLEYVLDRI